MTEILIKKKNVIMDSQILTTLQACERLTDFRFNHNLQPLSGKGNSLEAGWLMHKYLEAYYRSIKEGIRGQGAIDRAIEVGERAIREGMDGNGLENTPVENEKYPNGHLSRVGSAHVIDTFLQYCQHYKNESWTPLDIEKVYNKIIYEDSSLRVMWKGKLDLVTDNNQGIYPSDHKTFKMKRDTLDLNNQFMGQCVLTESRAVIINKIGWQTTLKPVEKFSRLVLSYSTARLLEWMEIATHYANYILTLSEQDYWPPRFTHCDKFAGCIFRSVCGTDPSMRQEELMLHFRVGEPWDVSDGED
jgi:hypothetical protein